MLRLLFVLLCLKASLVYAGHYHFNKECQSAYEAIMGLRFQQASSLIASEKQKDPDNLIPYFLDNYMDFLRAYINEDQEEFEKLRKNKNTRLDLLKNGDKSSPFHLYVKAEILIQWAFARLKYEEYFLAFREVRKAFQLLEENQAKFPDFEANKKSLALIHSIVGSIPDQYRWGVKLLGMSGSVSEGMREMESLIRHAEHNNFIFEEETYLYYAFMTLYIKKDGDSAWEILKGANLNLDNNLFNYFVMASVAMRTGKNDEAIEMLQVRPRSRDYLPFPYLDYMLGLAKLRRLDEDADRYLLRYLESFHGINYIKEAYQKLAWHALINGNTDVYHDYMRHCLEKGSAIIDDDKQALAEAESGRVPNAMLLKARLLFDGGYYKEALRELEGNSLDNFSRQEDKVEFTYRAGRIYDEAGNDEKAISFYKTTIHQGEALPLYYAASASLHLAYIYEEKGDTASAEEYFKRCMKMKDHPYRNSLQQKARVGLDGLD